MLGKHNWNLIQHFEISFDILNSYTDGSRPSCTAHATDSYSDILTSLTQTAATLHARQTRLKLNPTLWSLFWHFQFSYTDGSCPACTAHATETYSDILTSLTQTAAALHARQTQLKFNLTLWNLFRHFQFLRRRQLPCVHGTHGSAWLLEIRRKLRW